MCSRPHVGRVRKLREEGVGLTGVVLGMGRAFLLLRRSVSPVDMGNIIQRQTSFIFPATKCRRRSLTCGGTSTARDVPAPAAAGVWRQSVCTGERRGGLYDPVSPPARCGVAVAESDDLTDFGSKQRDLMIRRKPADSFERFIPGVKSKAECAVMHRHQSLASKIEMRLQGSSRAP